MSIRKLAPYALVAAFSLYSISPVLAEDKPPDKVSIKQGAPAGFEEYDAPRETAVDVNYGGLKIGSFRAIYTAKSLLFSRPEEIIEKISGIKFEDVPRVLKAISGELPTHADVICGPNPKPGCGKLLPEVAAFIFYEEKFRADLFLSPDVLAEQDTHKDKILPPAQDVYSAVHGFTGGVTGGTGAKQNYSLRSNSTYAYGAGRINTIGIVSAKEKQLNTATASLDRWGLDNRAGYFDSRASQLIAQVPMLGISTGTSLFTNLALRDAAGSRLTVFLPQRSYVSIIFNGVIFSTEFYEAGNQVLNTDNLPQGSYEVTLRIRDTNGGEVEEKRFFAKNFAIPPEEQPIYYGQLGTIRDLKTNRFTLNAGQGAIASAGTTQRITESAGGNASVSFIKDQLFSEAGVFVLLPPDHQIVASTMLSSSKDAGVGLSYLGYAYDRTLSIASDARVIRSGKKTDPGLVDPSDPVKTSSKQMSGTAAFQVTPLATVAMQGQYNITGGSPGSKYAYGPQFRYDFWRGDDSMLTLTTDTSQTEEGNVSNIFLRYTIRVGAWIYNAEGNMIKRSDGTTKSGTTRVTWNDDKNPGSFTIVGAELNRQASVNSRQADIDHRGDYGNIRILGSQSENIDTNTSRNFYSGVVGFSVVDADHEYSWGGNQQQSSGVVVKNTGNSNDIPMKILINNAEQTTFNTGKETTVFVTPYQTYSVSIKPAQSAAIDYDGTVKNVTLYPGNILPMVWVINRINVVLGHVVMPDGTPLAGAKLEEARNITVSDDDGQFQGELLELKKITFKREAEVEKTPEKEVDIFSILPTMRPHKRDLSKMSAEAQEKAMEELFGPDAVATDPADVTATSVAEAAATTTATQEARPPAKPVEIIAATTPADATATNVASVESEIEKPTQVVAPPKKMRPAVRCEVILPETKELNGVYIYSEPLVCNPIPFEEEKKDKSGEEKQAHWSPYTQPMRVSSLLQPLLESHNEFAMAVMNIQPKPVLQKDQPTPLLGEPEKAYAQAKPAKPQKVVKPSVLAMPSFASAPVTKSTAVLVQLGAYRSEAEARSAWDAITQKFDEMRQNTPIIAKVNLPEKGIYYRLRVANFSNARQAKSFCDNLTIKGQACLVAKNDAEFKKKLIEEGEIELPTPLMTAESLESPAQPESLNLPESSSSVVTPRLSPHAEVAPAPAAKPKEFSAKPRSFGGMVAAQLGAFRTQSEAEAAIRKAVQSFEVLERNRPVIIKVNLKEKGVFYRIRVEHFPSTGAARSFCQDMAAKGQACIVHTEDADGKDIENIKYQANGAVVPMMNVGGPFIDGELN